METQVTCLFKEWSLQGSTTVMQPPSLWWCLNDTLLLLLLTSKGASVSLPFLSVNEHCALLRVNLPFLARSCQVYSCMCVSTVHNYVTVCGCISSLCQLNLTKSTECSMMKTKYYQKKRKLEKVALFSEPPAIYYVLHTVYTTYCTYCIL